MEGAPDEELCRLALVLGRAADRVRLSMEERRQQRSAAGSRRASPKACSMLPPR